jgi:hypothetical protein
MSSEFQLGTNFPARFEFDSERSYANRDRWFLGKKDRGKGTDLFVEK